ncbi:hypothetical protein [Planotetraspora mira]|uniref:hypothetical protein n=1 Tax=Planotetraspora mira TaxID=58121 RepID=UPI0019500D22|nr:hypothetical protein [Planotetraspora mira]
MSSTSAPGSNWRRTAELVPSAPTSRSPTAKVPSAKCARTRPSPAWSYRTNVLPKWRTSSRPDSRISRSVNRLTPKKTSSGSAGMLQRMLENLTGTGAEALS